MVFTLNVTSYDPSLVSCKADYFIFCVLLYIFLISLTLVTVVGNLLVIISIIHFKQLHSPTNYLILSLAVADLLIGLLIFPLNMAFSVHFCMETMNVFCKLRYSLDYMISVTSILNLCCISVDRFYAVCQPLMYKSKITDQVVGLMITFAWLAAFIFGILAMAVITSFETCTEVCFSLICLICVLTYYVPSIVLISVYFNIYLVSQRQARSIQNTGPAPSKKERKATKTMSIVIGLFLLCWLPLFILFPIHTLNYISVILFEPFNWLAMSNSMLNPFIYAFFYKWFRSAFHMIVSGKILRSDLMEKQVCSPLSFCPRKESEQTCRKRFAV
uniref:G-protein coupled receptors family 1 profile domain-containing protein n=1 Tax=Salarias fasciatus TaxID=181472 RepID=A0A672F5I2_SALFA